MIHKLFLVYGEDQVAHKESRLGDCKCERDEHKGGVIVTLKMVTPQELIRDRKFAFKVYRVIKEEAKSARHHKLIHVMMDQVETDLYFEKKRKGR